MSTSNQASVTENDSAQAKEDFEDALDSLHSLPMSLIPLETAALTRTVLTKNARLDTVVELFRGQGCGNGHIAVPELPSFFSNEGGQLTRDMRILDKLSELGSFDVYSLRIQLRDLDIGFENFEALKLSDRKRAELTEYMKNFTRPLIQRIYGSEQDNVSDVSEVIKLIAQPNRDEAIRQLKRMADELEVSITEVPTFLEKYGEIFLSLSYFRNCLDKLMAELDAFEYWLKEIDTSKEVISQPMNNKGLAQTRAHLSAISTSVVGRFEFFNHRSQDFWHDINADSFREFRDLVTAHHVSIGTVLCGLAVKMQIWTERFPIRGGSPVKRMEFVLSEILPGLAKIRETEEKGAVSI